MGVHLERNHSNLMIWVLYYKDTHAFSPKQSMYKAICVYKNKFLNIFSS